MGCRFDSVNVLEEMPVILKYYVQLSGVYLGFPQICFSTECQKSCRRGHFGRIKPDGIHKQCGGCPKVTVRARATHPALSLRARPDRAGSGLGPDSLTATRGNKRQTCPRNLAGSTQTCLALFSLVTADTMLCMKPC